MKVILIQTVKGLGTIGDSVQVKDGFARNFLFPRHLALPANAGTAKAIEHQQRIVDVRMAQEKTRAEEEAARLAAVSCTLERHVGEEDKLYGSVTGRDVAEALVAEGFQVDHTQVDLEEPIKQLGVYQVPVRLAQGVETKVKVWVVAK